MSKQVDPWEAERKRRIRYMRRQAWRNAVRKNRIELAVMFAIFFGYLAFMIVWNCYVAPLRTAAAIREAEAEWDARQAAASAEQAVARVGKEVR